MGTLAAPASFRTIDDILDAFAGPAGRGALNDYVVMQSPRYLRLLEVLRDHTPLPLLPAPNVADLGAGLQTELFTAAYPQAHLTSVGFRDHAQRDYDDHVEFDLNASYDRAAWPTVRTPFDVVLFCEVIEHLYTTPIAVLSWIRSVMHPGAYLVVQTPNAQAVTRRIRSVLGKPLYGRITNFGEPGMNPGHFREYTPDELRAMGRATGFRVEHLELANYIHHQGRGGRAMMRAYDLMPEGLRQGATVVYRAI
ncbi:MAG: methyltransferase domain-containing protein [Solirubrobacteraceae bacterium]|nr:methyltransferase domain-containing protein [Solirubrobacteraceae bacterium]